MIDPRLRLWALIRVYTNAGLSEHDAIRVSVIILDKKRRGISVYIMRALAHILLVRAKHLG
jgi:hypothetical protein